MRGPHSLGCLGPNVYPEVPDGGWGWAVAATFFLVEVCTYGTLKSLGVFLQDLMEEFGESNSRVSWVISICVFIFTFTAPLSTMLSNRFGYRPVVMMGGFLISLGTITSAFVSSINEMYITIGIVSGLGYCLSFLPTVTILAQYFSRRRALVTSVASSGESFAIFMFAPALTKLKQHIGWRYCLVVLGIFQALVIGCGLLLRPIIIEPEPGKEDGESDKESLSLKQLEAVYELENEQTRTSISSGISQGSEDSGVTSLSASNVDLRTAGAGEVQDTGDKELSLSSPPTPVKEDKSELAEVEVMVEAGALHPSSPKLLDFSVLKDGAFIWYSLFGLFATLGFFAPQLYIIELSKSRGVEPSMASCTLSVMAVAEIFGRLSIGVVLNKVRCKKTLVLLGCVILLCLVLVAFTIVWEFWGLVVCCALYGYFMGTVGSTHIPMLAEEDVVGIHKMASSVGVYVCIQSFAGLAGPPLGGVLVDVTQNYGAAFYSCAVGMGLSAICLALVGPAKSAMCQRQSRNKEEGMSREVEKISQDSEQADFLEVDLALEDSPVRKAVDQDNASVI
ncbi:solute carrier family 16 member 6b [Epinephelus lanceolatus]|uniref:solute carrier family 16 member 6b n=1 Tax=Epinephelus lanceolatus TaxID=310571 RepID=UPI0014485A0C|nr:solute carrier family 16 member 6b [Epinephelus lanceolatus]XP_033500874.1 solute carrier family 16 member 6b [Epinephelus lanceolatus]XP_033500875.1 solute carrier family 16 member 6b [Epinephelus lanceolatus]XP_033500876.1 solute carrier family 16 member 6b [Epinephelus lanceolatus]